MYARGMNPSLQLLLVAMGVTILGVMPVFLLGAFGSVIRLDLGFDEARFGLTVAIGFGSGAFTSMLIGRWIERVGARRAFQVSLALAAIALLGIATLALTWALLAAFVAVGGVANGLAQPSSNLALAQSLPSRPALMFGAKQSGAPAATLLAGLAVPVLGSTVGWRGTFMVVACSAVVVALLIPAEFPDRRSKGDRAAASPDLRIALLVGLAIATGIGTAGATSLASFVVGSAVADGVALEEAGWLLTIGSGAAILARLGMGSWADRWARGRLALVSGMLAAGAAGLFFLSFGATSFVWAGTVLAFAGGWGWTGLLMFATVRLNEGSPARATGIVQAGAATGAAAGPFAFGTLVVNFSYSTAWRAAAGAAVVAALLILLVRARILVDRI